MNHTTVVGIDVGGSHISAALVDMETSALVSGSYVRREINTQGSVEEIIDNWCDVIQQAQKFDGTSSGKIGIAMPGPFDYPNGVSLIKDQNKYDILYKLNVKELLAEKLLVQADDIRFLNDAECFLLGEVFCGAAQGVEQVLGLTLGTGLGSAWCHHGKVEDADLWNSPFKEGIAEDYLSTRWFVNRFRELTGQEVKGVKELVDLASQNPTVQTVFNEFGRNLADFIKLAVKPLGAVMVVIGGNISKAYPLFSGELEKQLQNEGLSIPIRVAELGEESALIGAASSWKGSLLEKEEAASALRK
ncbi:ROK family protein [Rufibacter sediminis]|uniref:ROK family protein n=1 Tax=Rufibacter sediminis TaxID=2762756 RepID=A0ABR6VTT9_9BACT|nr:ROK family protein [Rufibacter sediminis]MBC3540036.1 ROK family protein [Rufibacter sediminis]